MELVAFCERTADNIIGVAEALTHHIIHDHLHEAGKHIRNHSGHCESLVFRTAVAMGISDEEELAALMIAAYLHDIGKIGINPFIVGKEGVLKPWEFEIIKQHVRLRVIILIVETIFGSPFMSLPKLVTDFIMGHQQKGKLTGYPLRSEHPFESYAMLDLMRVVDEFQAGFCKERSWRDPKSYEDMEKDLKGRAAKGFLNKRIVDVFFDSPVQDVFHDEYFRPILQTKIISQVGVIKRPVYNRLLNFKF